MARFYLGFEDRQCTRRRTGWQSPAGPVFRQLHGGPSSSSSSLFGENRRKATVEKNSNGGLHACWESRRLQQTQMPLEGPFSRLKHQIVAKSPRFTGCGKLDGFLSVPCRVTVLPGVVYRSFPAGGRWCGCWSAARCVWMACVPKCRLIATGFPESELTRCQQARASGAGGADFFREPFCGRRCRGSLTALLRAADSGSCLLFTCRVVSCLAF